MTVSPTFDTSGTQAADHGYEMCVMWPSEDGSICPFSVTKQFYSFIVMFVLFEANLCDEADCGVVWFPYFVRISAVWGSWNSNSPFVLFDPREWPFLHFKNTTF